MTFADELAVVGTSVGEINAILEAAELHRPKKYASLNDAAIRMEHVSFTYKQEDGEVLHGISLDIASSTVTALVGYFGSGKSAIAKLIAGFWDVSGGRVTLGSVDLKEVLLAQFNRQIAYVSQDNYLFDRTVRENIRTSCMSTSDTEVDAVAKVAECDGFIRALD